MDKRAHNSLEYYLPGASPRFLLFSVLPGNEFESGPLLEHNLIEHPENLPDFLYIPPVIPSAVAAKTRKICTVTTSTGSFCRRRRSEARSVMAIVSPYQFTLCVDIHEDLTDAWILFIRHGSDV